MKTDQIAYYVHNEDQAEEVRRLLRLDNTGGYSRTWVEDEVEGWLELFDNHGAKVHEGPSRAHLRFNYDNGIETELLTYLQGLHWHMHRYEYRVKMPFLSHVGIHMEPGEQSFLAGNAPLVQRMKTTKHTNPYLLERKRTYLYEIYDTCNSLGHYTKLIWRQEP